MRLFLDTANIEEIREALSWGVISGVTTNPTLVAKEGKEFLPTIREIAVLVDGPVSAEAVSMEPEGMVREARELSALAPNVVVKLPAGVPGLKATRILAADGIKVNMTLVFSANQALLAALAGAAYVSPFAGRLDDIGHSGMDVVAEIVELYSFHGLDTEVIAASIRHPAHVQEAARAGSDIATVPFKVLQEMIRHPLTDTGVARFLEDYRKIPR
ncbi:MAG: fructose-6-phosphate aldolase [Firmicutes bacterium RBG_13_65_8]|nr:MAG: fructose-6-phosphate aldolase [Firmicutes bacterium RBG_13_65_8]